MNHEPITTEVPMDLDEVKVKLLFNLTKRQLICFAMAAVAGGAGYFMTKESLGSSVAAFVLILAAMPFFLLAMYTKDGLPAEKIIWYAVRHKFIMKAERPRDTGTRFTREEERRKLEEEVRYLERKAGIGKNAASERRTGRPAGNRKK